MIPKKIHYCWFGYKEKPKLALKCISSWKKYCPGYEIIEWNENNFDINMNPYTKSCYENKQYAFLTDYVRLLVIAQHGGIYFDTDVEVVRSLDPLMNEKAFFGFEDSAHVNTGIGFGAEPNSRIVEDMLREYDGLLDGKHGTIGCPQLNTRTMIKNNFVMNGQKQVIDGVVVYPVDYFSPYDDPTGRLHKTQNTYSIHWFGKSWMGKTKVLRSKISKPFHRIFGTGCFDFLKKS